jgi:hypothetical protein
MLALTDFLFEVDRLFKTYDHPRSHAAPLAEQHAK